MSRILLLHPAAELDVASARVWYDRKSTTAGARFFTEFSRAAESISNDPLRWPENRHGVRRTLLRKFPYSVHYVVEPDHVMVIAVSHFKRRPGLWMRRLERR